ncbi:hypothetical protein [Paracoccus versutus]|uniref:hypothetical protein n=1 Tax=Paracoccus versutus TaxID=34007 RepID=UPI001AD80B73|nr:hypothetical protein [Paracoccus versutus]
MPLIVAMGQAGYAFAPAAFGLLRGGGMIGGSGSALLFACAAAIQLAAIGCFLAGRGGKAVPPGAGVTRIEVGSDAPRRTSMRSHRTRPIAAGLAHPMLRGCILRSCR